jgi:hypothetical protein
VLWTLDSRAALAGSLSPLEAGNRLVGLLLAVPLLAVLLWQWQQLVQSLWLLSRPAGDLAAVTPLPAERVSSERLCLGIPLLLLNPLALESSPKADGPADGSPPPDASGAGEPVAVEPEQGTAADQGGDLDQQIE